MRRHFGQQFLVAHTQHRDPLRFWCNTELVQAFEETLDERVALQQQSVLQLTDGTDGTIKHFHAVFVLLAVYGILHCLHKVVIVLNVPLRVGHEVNPTQ